MKKLYCEFMPKLNFYYNEEESNIKYEYSFFNGIPNIKNIEIKDIKPDSFNINWEIDENKNIDNNKIKYIIEIRKENENFKKVYEDNNKNYLINNLIEDTNYELRICSFYNNSYGLWSEIQKVKTEFLIDSNILKDCEKKVEYVKKLIEWTGYNKLELIYRGSRDGTTSIKFHEKCDNKGPTIVLFKNEKGNIYGGYCPISWKSEGGWQSVPEAFIFTLTNIYNIEPTKFNRNVNDNNGIYFDKSHGPWFGLASNIGFENDYTQFNNCYSYFGVDGRKSYTDSLGKGKSIFTGDENNNNVYYKIKEIETFKLNK